MNEELLISGARNQPVQQKDLNNYESNMYLPFWDNIRPHIDKHYSFDNFDKFIVHSAENLQELSTIIN